MDNQLEEKKDKPTWSATLRRERIEQIRLEIKEHGKMTRQEVYRFALLKFGLSLRMIDVYLKEIALYPNIEYIQDTSTWVPENDQFVWK